MSDYLVLAEKAAREAGRFLAERVGKVDKGRADEGGGKATGMLS